LDGVTDGVVGGAVTDANQQERCDAALEYGQAACERAERCGRRWWLWGWDRTECSHQTAATLSSFIALDYYGRGSSVATVRECASKLRDSSCEPVNDCALFQQWSSKKREIGIECDSTDDCKVGLACIEGACATLRTEGGDCRRSEDCARGLSCQDDACKPVVDGTTKCRDDEECSDERAENGYALFTFWCYGGNLYCDESTLVCRKTVRDRKLDEACDRGHLCEDGLHCEGLLGVVGTPKCKPVAKYGEACNETNCVSCQDGICADPLDGVCR